MSSTRDRYGPSGNDCIAVVDAVDGSHLGRLRRTLEEILTRAYQEGLSDRTLPQDVQEALLNAWGAYEALEVAIGSPLATVLPGFPHCRDKLRKVLHEADLLHG